ncbi:MAG: AEC family transporter [Candidatus Micrarchaeia archaeon]
MDIVRVLGVSFPAFFIMGLGYCLGKYRKIDVGSLADMTIYVLSPFLMLYSLGIGQLGPELVGFVVVSLAVMIISGVIGFLGTRLFGFSDEDARIVLMTSMLINTGNMGLSFCLFAFGNEGLSLGAYYMVVNTIIMYTAGVYIASGSRMLEFLKLPLVYFVAAGIALSALSIKLPAPIFGVVELLGKSALPVQLIMLGVQLSRIKPDARKIKLPCLNAFVRLIIGPVVAFVLCSFAGISGIYMGVLVLQSAMPSAVTNFLLAAKYRRREELVASIVFVSTLLSLLTIPAVLIFIMGS